MNIDVTLIHYSETLKNGRGSRGVEQITTYLNPTRGANPVGYPDTREIHYHVHTFLDVRICLAMSNS